MQTFLLCMTIIAIIVCVVAVVINLKPIQDLLKAKLDNVQLQTITDITKACVGYAKQWLTSKTGEEKKAWVTERVIAKAFELGIIVTQEDIEVILESAYEQIKDK